MNKRKPRGYWMEKKNIVREMNSVIRKHLLNEIPSEKQTHELGYTQLADAIDRNYGWRNLRIEFGNRQIRVSNNQWKNKNYTVKYAKQVIKNEGWEILPSLNVLGDKGHSNLANAITRHYGGVQKFRAILKQKNYRVANGLYKNRNIVDSQLKEIIAKHSLKETPSQTWLNKHGYFSLSSGISRYHGGFRALRKSLDQEQLTIEPGRWQDLDFTLHYAIEVMKKHNFNEFPTAKKLNEMRENSLRHAVYKYHSGIAQFRELVQQKLGKQHSSKQLENLLQNYIGDQDD